MKKILKMFSVWVLAISLLGGELAPGMVYAAERAEDTTKSTEAETVVAEVVGVETVKFDAAVAEEDEFAAFVQEARDALKVIVEDREIMAVVYMTSEYAVKTEADGESDTVLAVPSGQTVLIEDVFVNAAFEVWEYVSFYNGEQQYFGYIERGYLACSDERFLAWEENYGMNPGAAAPYSIEEDGSARTSYADIAQFPASYQAALTALKEQHPNWTFVPMNTGLDWDTVIANELLYGRSLVHKSFPACAKEGVYDGGTWYFASEDILEYYMDPRNGLTEGNIFQFEQLTYNETYHTEEAVKAFLENTFMKSDKNAPGTAMTYAYIIWAIGKEDIRRVSPFHLAARIYQEQGNGTSPLISGTYPGYEGYYNYFNVGATGTTDKMVIQSGLAYAKSKNWYNAYYSILGGADVITANYIRKGQDTLYLQKYNVNPQGGYALYTHQYMQNISAPASEAKSIKSLYAKANSLDNTFVFKIPVYENMPEAASEYPTSSTNIVLQIPEGYGYLVYMNGVLYSPQKRNGLYIVTAPSTNVKAAAVYKHNEDGTILLDAYHWSLNHVDGAYTATFQSAHTPDASGLSCTACGAALPWFADVKPDGWEHPYVFYAYRNNIMAGKGKDSDGNIIFDPNTDISRAEFATVLYNYAGKPQVDYQAIFSDVPAGEYYSEAVTWACQQGIAEGYGNGKYGSGDAITREQMAVMLYKYARLRGFDVTATADLSGFADSAQVDDWALVQIQWANANGIINGDGTKLYPLGNTSRAQCATMMKNFIDKFNG